LEWIVSDKRKMDLKEDVNSLIHALKAEKWDVRRKAAWALGTMGKSAVEPLIIALRDEKWDVRRKAAWALGNIRDFRGVEPLIIALRDECPDVREEAAWALGNIRELRGVEPLIIALRDDYSSVRRQAARSLALLSEEPVKTAIHDYESTLEERDRDAFQNCKKLYMQELKKRLHSGQGQ
jgi:HEAT repeat protein